MHVDVQTLAVEAVVAAGGCSDAAAQELVARLPETAVEALAKVATEAVDGVFRAAHSVGPPVLRPLRLEAFAGAARNKLRADVESILTSRQVARQPGAATHKDSCGDEPGRD